MNRILRACLGACVAVAILLGAATTASAQVTRGSALSQTEQTYVSFTEEYFDWEQTQEWEAVVEFSNRLVAFATLTEVAQGTAIVCPVPSSTFVSSWGAPRSLDGWHRGVDMMAPHGTVIVAPSSGTLRSTTQSFYVTDTPSGIEFFGTHNQGALAPDGPVKAGQPIALVGSSGNASASAPHLHLEIKPGGVPTDPYPLTRAACGRSAEWPRAMELIGQGAGEAKV